MEAVVVSDKKKEDSNKKLLQFSVKIIANIHNLSAPIYKYVQKRSIFRN